MGLGSAFLLGASFFRDTIVPFFDRGATTRHRVANVVSPCLYVGGASLALLLSAFFVYTLGCLYPLGISSSYQGAFSLGVPIFFCDFSFDPLRLLCGGTTGGVIYAVFFPRASALYFFILWPFGLPCLLTSFVVSLQPYGWDLVRSRSNWTAFTEEGGLFVLPSSRQNR